MNAISMSFRKDARSTAGVIDYASETAEAPADASQASVPLKPTAAMLAAGSRAGGVSVEIAWKIYLAMIREAN